MRLAGFRLIAVLLLLVLLVPAAIARGADASGGASADSAAGGPLDAGALPYGAPTRQRPIARSFKVTPVRVTEGAGGVRLKLRVDERGVDRVSARVVAIDSATRNVGARFSLGRIRTGRTLKLVWPRKHVPPPGTYLVRLHVKDPQGATLVRAAAATGKSRLVVRARPRPERSQPGPPAQPTLPAPISGGLFPVAGPHTFGNDDSRFGAGRTGHIHEGQDVLAAEGTPLVSPLPGTVRFVDTQDKGAGLYVVLDADDGRTLFFAHLQTGTAAVVVGQRVTAGGPIGRIGMTGATTGPHLHFEIWEGGWRDRGGHPIDPLPQLLAWDQQPA
jgi:murein DD-endopeptidase MepM/ murein hydrolase activator NlpD